MIFPFLYFSVRVMEQENNLTADWESSQALDPQLGLILKVSYLTVCILGLIVNILLLAIIIG